MYVPLLDRHFCYSAIYTFVAYCCDQNYLMLKIIPHITLAIAVYEAYCIVHVNVSFGDKAAWWIFY